MGAEWPGERGRHRFVGGGHTVVVADQTLGASAVTPDRVVEVSDPPYRASSRHLLECRRTGVLQSSCLIVAGGGATGVHAHSAVLHHDVCYVVAGDRLLALRLPQLELVWSRKADDATCFGVHLVADPAGLIVHGELSISRFSLSGEVVWSVGGADIFTGDFTVGATHVVATDFNEQRYRIALEDGTSVDSLNL